MQTNAPAGGEWVDQYNRAVTFGQIDVDQLANLPAHASTHATGGSDSVSPASIGAASTTHASTHSISGTDPLSQFAVNSTIFYKTNSFNLLASLSTTADFFTVPAGYRFVVGDLTLLITASTVNGGGTVITAPSFRVIGSSAGNLNNSLTLRTTTYNLNDVDKQVTFTATNTSAPAGDVVRLNVATAIVQGATPRYSTLTGTFVLTGYMIPA
jgi:hypothetical protein